MTGNITLTSWQLHFYNLIAKWVPNPRGGGRLEAHGSVWLGPTTNAWIVKSHVRSVPPRYIHWQQLATAGWFFQITAAYIRHIQQLAVAIIISLLLSSVCQHKLAVSLMPVCLCLLAICGAVECRPRPRLMPLLLRLPRPSLLHLLLPRLRFKCLLMLLPRLSLRLR
jgi:hypothetical protein